MPIIDFPDSFTVTVHGHTMDAARLSDMTGDAIAYLVRNGFTQSITDAAAFSASDKADLSEFDVAAMAAEKRQTRFDAILAGTVGSAGPRGPRLGALERGAVDFAIASIKLTPAISSGRVVWPTGQGSAAIIKSWVDQWMARPGNRDRALAESQRAIDALAVDADFDPTA